MEVAPKVGQKKMDEEKSLEQEGYWRNRVHDVDAVRIQITKLFHVAEKKNV